MNSSTLDPKPSIDSYTNRISVSNPKDMAFQRPYLFLALKVAVLAIAPSALVFAVLAVFDALPLGLIFSAFWFSICLNLLIGGTARMTALDLDTGEEATTEVGIQLIKKRFVPLSVGYIVYSLVLSLAAALVLGIVFGLSMLWSVLAALLTIPAIVAVLVILAVLSNTFFYPAVVGYEDASMKDSASVLVARCLKSPFQLLENSIEVVRVFVTAFLSSGVILLTGVAGGLFLTLGPQLGSGVNVEEMLGGFAGVIRFISLATVFFLWMAYMVNVVTISYAMSYRSASDKA